MLSPIDGFLQLYASLGWRLHPCYSKSADPKRPKSPRLAGWQTRASSDIDTLRKYAASAGEAAWGLATSAALGVLNVDPRHGGDAESAKLVAEHGPLPPTPMAEIGGGGLHYFLRFAPGTGCPSMKVVGLWGLDIKCDGGNVILPPSRIECPAHDGRAYRWAVSPLDVPVANAPEWLAELVRRATGTIGSGRVPRPRADKRSDEGQPARAEGEQLIAVLGEPLVDDTSPWTVCGEDTLASHPGAPEGLRRATLYRLVGAALGAGREAGLIRVEAEAWAGRCQPPFDEWERHVEGLIRRERPVVAEQPRPEKETPAPVAEGSSTSSVATPEAGPAGRTASSFLPAEGASQSAPVADVGEVLLADPPLPAHDGWPVLAPAACRGLLGRMLAAVMPETEAHPAGILMGWLACFGSAVGRGAWVTVGPRRHHPALYVGIVGRTSDAKGDSWAVAQWPFRRADPRWSAACVCHGVGSGERLVERVRDESRVVEVDKRSGQLVETVIPGAEDKRCLLRLSELSAVFKKQRRDGSSLSEVLREAWDGEPLTLPNRKANALSANGYLLSVVGDVTPTVLGKLLASGPEAVDGSANRFLWVAVRSPRSLPGGGDIRVLEPFVQPLAEVVVFGQQAGELRRDADAERLWAEVHPSLKGRAIPSRTPTGGGPRSSG